MEISVSVLDTLDLVRSSIEEEVGPGLLSTLRPLFRDSLVSRSHPHMSIKIPVLATCHHFRNHPHSTHPCLTPTPPHPTPLQTQVVFQATLQIPAHHAVACRIEAYNTPFAAAHPLRAPDLQTAASLTEEDQQFAACLASPPDMEEAHEIRLQRPGAEAASFLQRSAPSLR
jgi:hypothetical protein